MLYGLEPVAVAAKCNDFLEITTFFFAVRGVFEILILTVVGCFFGGPGGVSGEGNSASLYCNLCLSNWMCFIKLISACPVED